MLKLGDRAFLAEAEKRMGGFLGELTALEPALRAIRSASTTPRRSPPSGWRWSATPRTASIRSRGRGVNLGFRDVAALVEVLVEGKRLGLDLGDAAVARRATSAGAGSTRSWSPRRPTG